MHFHFQDFLHPFCLKNTLQSLGAIPCKAVFLFASLDDSSPPLKSHANLFFSKSDRVKFSKFLDRYCQKQPPRQFSKISVLFFQEQPFYNFPGGSICSSNRHEFSRRVYMFFKQTRIFQEGLSKRHVFSRRFYLFVEQTLLSHRTDINFPRSPYLVLEHIRIFQEALSSPRTPTIFQASPRTHTLSRSLLCFEHIGIFQEGAPSRTDISLIGLGGCFRIAIYLLIEAYMF